MSMLGTGIVIAAIAGYLGLSLAIGALFAGLAFSRDPQAVHTDTKFMYFYELLTPFLFIYIGMQVDPSSISSSLSLATILFILAILGKFFGVAVPALLITNKLVLQIKMNRMRMSNQSKWKWGNSKLGRCNHQTQHTYYSLYSDSNIESKLSNK